MGKTKAKKPTLDQKKLITAAGYAWKDLLVLEETEEELRLVWRGSGKILLINKSEARAKALERKESEAGRKIYTNANRSQRAGTNKRRIKNAR